MDAEVPPEVPDEFAAAYRDAYERALAAQSVPKPEGSVGEHAELPDEAGLPVRTRPIRLATHRSEEQRSTYERVRDSRAFVPALLLLLLVLLIVAAYVVGRLFAARVG